MLGDRWRDYRRKEFLGFFCWDFLCDFVFVGLFVIFLGVFMRRVFWVFLIAGCRGEIMWVWGRLEVSGEGL